MKQRLLEVARRLGYDVRRLRNTPAGQLELAMRCFGIDLVFDVGANVGQFASQLRRSGYEGRIVSFEPLTVAHARLKRAAGTDAQWSVHERCALGNATGSVEINVSKNSVSSSILQMSELHAQVAPGSVFIKKETVPIFRLDQIAPQYLDGSQGVLLKIDTQGFELPVIEGARDCMSAFSGVYCELSLASLYLGQSSWVDVISRLEGVGFELWSLNTGLQDLNEGRTLQVDALLRRTGTE